MVDRKTEFEQKVNFGLYAVSYGTYAIDEKALEDSGKDYRYRKVYINIPLNDEKFMFTEGSPFGVNVAFVKDSLSEEDLKQALAFYDFCFTEAGKKLTVWGPRSAGLWTEEDGKRKFVDQELEDCMVNDVANDKDIYYGINGKAWPSYPHIAANQYHPKLIYDEVRQPKLANRYFSMGMLEQQELTTAIAPNIWEFDSRGVEGVSRFWQSRAAFEDALTKVFIAQDDAEFEKLYNDMVSLAEKNGLDDATLEEINRVYAEDVNAEFMDNLK